MSKSGSRWAAAQTTTTCAPPPWLRWIAYQPALARSERSSERVAHGKRTLIERRPFRAIWEYGPSRSKVGGVEREVEAGELGPKAGRPGRSWGRAARTRRARAVEARREPIAEARG